MYHNFQANQCQLDILLHSYVKRTGESKQIDLVVWNSTVLPVWRHKFRIWANLAESPNCSNAAITYIMWTYVSYSNAAGGLVFP